MKSKNFETPLQNSPFYDILPPMSPFKKIWKIARLTIQFTLVFIYILFEEVIWERLAEPIYEKIQSLRLLQKLQNVVNGVDRYRLLLIFLSLLLGVEGAGLTAGYLVVKGKVLLARTPIYQYKIPIATVYLLAI